VGNTVCSWGANVGNGWVARYTDYSCAPIG
jgi:hypothetical protein